MKRSVRWTLLASVACGARHVSWLPAEAAAAAARPARRQQVVRHQDKAGAVTEGKKGGKLTYLAASDVDYLDPGQDYYTFGFMVQNADATARCTPSSPTTRSSRCRTSPRASRRSRPTRRRSRSRSARASSSRPRSTARSRPPTSSTPSSVPSRRTSRAATPVRTSSRSSALRRPVRARSSRSRASPRPTTTRSCSSSRSRRRRWCRQALVMPITVPVPEGVRVEVRQEGSVGLRQLRRVHRPLHGQERSLDGQGDRPFSRAS